MPKIDIKYAVTDYKVSGSLVLDTDFNGLAKIINENHDKSLVQAIKNAFCDEVTYQKEPFYIFETKTSVLCDLLRQSAFEASDRFESQEHTIELHEIQSIKKLQLQTQKLLASLKKQGWKLEMELKGVKLTHEGKEISEIDIAYHSSRTIRELQELLVACEQWLDRVSPKRGRPNNSVYYAYIFQIAQLFQRLSTEKFTVLRHRENGEYMPITKGHEFAAYATLMVNRSVTQGRLSLFERIQQSVSNTVQEISEEEAEENALDALAELEKTKKIPSKLIIFYDDKMLLNACESAVVKLGKSEKIIPKK